jgi:DNA-binding response OmpR family regulator
MFQCQRILSSLTDLQIAKLKTNQKDELLIKLGFQSVIDNKIKVFSPLLDTYLKSGKQSIAPFVYDKENEQLFFLGKLINNLLSKREYRLLTFMSDSPNKVFSREEIMENVWGKDEYPTDWAFDKFVSRLRKKLALDKTNRNILKTNRELGICLVD